MYRFNERGSFVIDRRFRGVGRIRRASGTNDRKTFRAILTMLQQLYSTGKHAVLREIQSGVVTPLEAFGYWNAEQLEHLPSVATLRLVSPTIGDWIATHDVQPITRRNYKSEVSRFVKQVGNPSLSKLPEAVTQYRRFCDESGLARTFNGLRTVCLAFLRHALGKSSPLYLQVTDIPILTITTTHQAPQLSVVQAHEVIRQLPEVHAQIAKAMLLTGMGWGEVTGKWEVQGDRVLIYGTKTEHRIRFVPLVDPSIQQPTRASKAFRTALRAVRKDLSPYTFRRSFAHWLELARVPRSRRKLYLGHSTGDVTGGYEKPEIERFLVDDAEALRSFIFDEWGKRDQTQTPKLARPIAILTPKH